MAEYSENEAGLRDIPASDILDKIQKGEPVEYDHVRITGELDLNKLDLPMEHVARTESHIETLELPEESRIVSSSIKITNSKFDGKVNFGNNLFRYPNIFNNTTFDGYADFSKATFGGDADFSGATFSENADFRKATFSGYANFRGATFSKYAYFDNATFSGYAHFRGATFSKYAYFREPTFSGYAHFRETTFSENAYFSKATFSGYANFQGATFSNYAYFGNATFSSYAYFSGAAFANYAYFIGATFGGYADFNGAKFEGDVLAFRDATFLLASVQEQACRRAKNVLEKNGNREEAGYFISIERWMANGNKSNGISATQSLSSSN
jgi:Pentapeptide repeats (9 copies)